MRTGNLKRDSVFSGIGWGLPVFYLLFVALGVVNIYSAAYNVDSNSLFDFSQLHIKQAVWAVCGFVMAFVILQANPSGFDKWSWLVYGIAVFLLVLVLVFGTEIKGNKSWFVIGPMSLQPSEFAKFASSLALASYLSMYGISIRGNMKNLLLASCIIILPASLILLQPDAGSALVFVSLFLVLYVEGAPNFIFRTGLIIAVLFIGDVFIQFYKLDSNLVFGVLLALAALGLVLMIIGRKKIWPYILSSVVIVGFFAVLHFYAWNNVFKDYQRQRIYTSFKLVEDNKGVGFNTYQSEIAIGSGGLWGKGFLKGTQTKGNFVPEQHTDFIFSTLAEEWGFVGSVVVIILYSLFLWQILRVAVRQGNYFSRVYGLGVFSVFFMHYLVNIAMAIGIMPVIGIPLPFFSYGGSSLWAFTILLFILIRLDGDRKNTITSRASMNEARF